MASTTAEMESAFRNIDANGDGRISESELESLLRSLGSDTSTLEVRRMMAEMDKDGDGFIDFKEFAEFHSRTDLSVAGDELRSAFDVYDKDKNGLISAAELQAVLKCLGENVTLMDCAAMIATVDADGDGHVNFDEFKKMMR